MVGTKLIKDCRTIGSVTTRSFSCVFSVMIIIGRNLSAKGGRSVQLKAPVGEERRRINECRDSGHSRHDLSRKILALNVYLHAEEAGRGTSETNHHSSQTKTQNSLLSHCERG